MVDKNSVEYYNLKQNVYDFLISIGIEIEIQESTKGFFDHIHIEDGRLIVDKNASINDILHEAGHLAVLPGRFRKYASGNISGAIKRMLEEIDFSNPDAPEARAAIQCGDVEATAWAWAAGMHLELPPEIVIEDADYDHEGEEMRLTLNSNSFFGINGLAAAGFCVTNKAFSALTGKPVYPNLAMWLQN
ncbi:hypothetical protein G7B40_031505 [Aetokthonos hydrillicola Thurmond2011]|jgi:hypothetical protein|uniref:Uncharacterized protein n=1 Tax=Aetokthonos hydrillicola Thurmond2011 TaxID=2712845 RepID=A0AAP5IG29_9CYAN|nr:hypothetical protein [Aetokthonos hydrillicola]MBO3462856.1 hypothetical protein [Aetokthonos hydrillicola CCALA 1050]MBW4590977.1 hypothetical protein [Aetokthonos hydrillicola CCALA 1050]MDR9899053.1 hypothetical protein [Aetokthonos hydrillicola Thurmond2011]